MKRSYAYIWLMDTAALSNRLKSSPRMTGTGQKIGDVSWGRMIGAVEKVRERLRRAVAALEAERVPYALIGGNAVAAWVSQVDPSAARNTVDVDLLVNRGDFEQVKTALASAGFVHRPSASAYPAMRPQSDLAEWTAIEGLTPPPQAGQ